MKVLITTDWYIPAVNGVVTSILNLQRHLQNYGVDVRIVTLSDKREAYQDGNVYYLSSRNASRIYPGAKVHFRVFDHILDDVIQWKPDIIHSQTEFSTFLVARKIARKCCIPQVHTYHTMYEDFVRYVSPSVGIGKKGARLLTSAVCRRVQHVIVPSEKTEELLRRYHVRTPITCIPTGIETENFTGEFPQEERDRLRAAYGVRKEDTVLVYVGRLAAEKRPDELIYFFSHSNLPNCRLLLTGDGPYRKELEQIVKALNLGDRVIFTGMVSPAEIDRYYRMGDIFVSASRSETQGLTYFEAMASGLPLLCREDPCLKGVLMPGRNGYTFSDEGSFLENLHILADSKTEREAFGQNSRSLAEERYSAECFADSVLRIYQQLIHQYHCQIETHSFRSVRKLVS